MIQYKLQKNYMNEVCAITIIGQNISIPFDPDNTDYQAFKTAVLDQKPGGAVVEDGDSFSLNTNTDESILKDADGNSMTIEQAKEYIRTLP